MKDCQPHVMRPAWRSRSGSVLVFFSPTYLKGHPPPAMRILDLCCGTESIGKALQRIFPDQRYEYVTVDVDPKFQPTIVADMRDIDPAALWKPGEFDIVWASPPCTEYSRAKTTGVRDLATADAVVKGCIATIEHLQPRVWAIENPGSGMLRKRDFMQSMEPFRHECTYCKYGKRYRKLTDIWTNREGLVLERCCAAMPCPHLVNGCHPETAQKGPSVQSVTAMGKRTSVELYTVPYPLLKAILTLPPEGEPPEGEGVRQRGGSAPRRAWNRNARSERVRRRRASGV